jgi:DNA adenine methylase
MKQPSLFSHEISSSKREPPLKWAGGKRWLVPRLRDLIGDHLAYRRLVVPFCGGLGDVLGLWPQAALLNDTNEHLINFYRWWQRGLDASDKSIFTEDENIYAINKENFNELIRTGQTQTREAAELFYYLLRTCFNGLCRFNGSGEYNVGFGKRSKPVDYQAWLTGYNIPARWEFSCGDFSCFFTPEYSQENGVPEIILCDPPYDGTFTDYSRGGFHWSDQERLIDWLAPHRGPIIICNAATDRIIDLYGGAGYTVEVIMAPRRISCTGDRTAAREVLAYKNLEKV